MSTLVSRDLKGKGGASHKGPGIGEIHAAVVEPILYQKVKFVKENLRGLDSGR